MIIGDGALAAIGAEDTNAPHQAQDLLTAMAPVTLALDSLLGVLHSAKRSDRALA